MSMITESTSFRAADGASVPTYVARPEGFGPFPALIMGYEFWGMLDVAGGGPHMRHVAGRLAAEGYAAAVPDTYGARGQQPTMEGGTIRGGPSDAQTIADLCEAARWLGQLAFVDRARIGVIGWCGCGRQALFLAAKCPEIKASAAFYGRVINRPQQPGPSPIDLVGDIHCPVFGAYGEADRAIPVDTVRQFEAALARQGLEHEIHIYPGAEHAFMNDQRDSYHSASAADAWRRALAFFDRHLKA